jgi:hypothetical protein
VLPGAQQLPRAEPAAVEARPKRRVGFWGWIAGADLAETEE